MRDLMAAYLHTLTHGSGRAAPNMRDVAADDPLADAERFLALLKAHRAEMQTASMAQECQDAINGVESYIAWKHAQGDNA